ncbi:hypothetical protein TNCV_3137881 [Trichonephila clavipes]|nr:hypothetical protein TNCV_3137881 [Trichonephila clavipes]
MLKRVIVTEWNTISSEETSKLVQSMPKGLTEVLRRSFKMREKGGNRLVPGPDYMVDALKTSQPSSQSFWRVTTDMCSGVVLMEHNTYSVGQFWPFLFNR